jgi:hypothetical protein
MKAEHLPAIASGAHVQSLEEKIKAFNSGC